MENLEYKRQRREISRRYYEKNRVKVRGRQRRYYLLNKEKFLEANRRWVRENHEKHKLNQTRYYSINAEKIRSRIRAYDQKNWVRRAWRTLRARAKNKPHASLEELQSLLLHQGEKCAFSGLPIGYRTAQLDHKIPASRGGTHTIENLQWLHKHVNLMKHNLPMPEFKEVFDKIMKGRLATDGWF